MSKTFNFKQFSLTRTKAGMKLSTDAVLLGSWAAQLFPNAQRVLDIGTGTGILSLLYAQFNPQSLIHALDIEAGAIEDAAYNFKSSPFYERLSCQEGDILKITINDLPEHTLPDLIISNPPYFREQPNLHGTTKERYTARHNNSLPLLSLFTKAYELLAPNGIFALMLPAIEENNLLTICQKTGFTVVEQRLISSVKSKEPYLILLGVQKASLPLSTTTTKKKVQVKHDYLLTKDNLHSNKPIKSSFWAQLTKDVYLNS